MLDTRFVRFGLLCLILIGIWLMEFTCGAHAQSLEETEEYNWVRLCDGRQIWQIVEQQLLTYSVNPGSLFFRLCFQEIFSSGPWDMVRWRCVEQVRDNAHYGWADVFESDSRTYNVLENSRFTIQQSDIPDAFIKATFSFKLGYNNHKETNFIYRSITTLTSVCRSASYNTNLTVYS